MRCRDRQKSTSQMPKVKGEGGVLGANAHGLTQASPISQALTMSCLSGSLSQSQHLPREEKSERARPACIQGRGGPRHRARATKSPSCPCVGLPQPPRPTQSFRPGEVLPSGCCLHFAARGPKGTKEGGKSQGNVGGGLATPGQVHTVDGRLDFPCKCFPLGVNGSSQVHGSPSLRLTGMEGHHLHPRSPVVLDQV